MEKNEVKNKNKGPFSYAKIHFNYKNLKDRDSWLIVPDNETSPKLTKVYHASTHNAQYDNKKQDVGGVRAMYQKLLQKQETKDKGSIAKIFKGKLFDRRGFRLGEIFLRRPYQLICFNFLP